MHEVFFFHYSGINYTITTDITENNSDDTNNNINKLNWVTLNEHIKYDSAGSLIV